MARRRASKHHTTVTLISVICLVIAILMVFISSSSISKNGITLLNKAAGTSMSPINRWGNAADFDGLSSYIEAPATIPVNAQFGFTAEAWFKLRFDPNSYVDQSMTIVNKINYEDENFLLNVGIRSEDAQKYNLDYYFVVNNQRYDCHSDWTVASHQRLDYQHASAWHHLAGVIQPNGDLSIFADGVKETGSIGNVSGTCKSAAPIRVGAVGFGSHRGYFSGQIDELRLSNTARYQVSFQPSLTPFVRDANTMLLYHFDEKDGVTSIADDSSNGYAGVINGPVHFVTSTIPFPFAGAGK